MRRDDGRDPLGDMNAGALQRLDLIGIIGQKPHASYVEVAQDLGRHLVIPQVGRKTQPFVGLHGVCAAILKLVGAELIEQTDATAFLVLVNQQSPALFGDQIQRQLELGSAITAEAMKHVAGEAFRVDANQGRLVTAGQVAHAEHDAFLDIAAVYAFEAEDPKMTETAGKIGFRHLSEHGGDFAFIIMIGRRAMLEPQQLVVLLLRLAVAASLASILSRFPAFQRMLMREERTLVQRAKLALSCAAAYGAGVATRVFTHKYEAVDLGLEGSLVAGMVGGYVTGLLSGVMIAIPAMFAGEFTTMPLFAGIGVLGGLLRDIAPEKEDIWRFSLFFSLSPAKLRKRQHQLRALFQLGCLFSIIFAELLRLSAARLFPVRGGVFCLAQTWHVTNSWAVLAIFASTVFAVMLPLKIWNNTRNEKKLEAQQLRLNEARLAALTSQINPHFLFNTLNSVSSLIRTNPDQARSVVYRLSSILRRLLRKTDNLTPLRDELAFIDNYMNIEMVRFGDKLRFVKEIDPETMDRMVPSMMLQPIIENSIRHGLSSKVEGGMIRVRSWLADGKLQLVVEDDGVGIPEEKLAKLFERGIGVSNVNERLQVLFGQDYRMWIDSKPGEGTRTGIEIPDVQVAAEELTAAG